MPIPDRFAIWREPKDINDLFLAVHELVVAYRDVGIEVLSNNTEVCNDQGLFMRREIGFLVRVKKTGQSKRYLLSTFGDFFDEVRIGLSDRMWAHFLDNFRRRYLAKLLQKGFSPANIESFLSDPSVMLVRETLINLENVRLKEPSSVSLETIRVMRTLLDKIEDAARQESNATPQNFPTLWDRLSRPSLE